MRVWKRKKGHDTWHWCKNCSDYPTGSDVLTSDHKPTDGELCNQCKGKEKNGNCQE